MFFKSVSCDSTRRVCAWAFRVRVFSERVWKRNYSVCIDLVVSVLGLTCVTQKPSRFFINLIQKFPKIVISVDTCFILKLLLVQAYMRPKSTAVQIARIAAITLVTMTVVLGSFILAAAWVRARATCTPEAVAAMQAELRLQQQQQQQPSYTYQQGEFLKHLQPQALIQVSLKISFEVGLWLSRSGIMTKTFEDILGIFIKKLQCVEFSV